MSTATATATSWWGADYNDAGGDDAGAAYLVYGPIAGTLDLADADVKFTGEEAGDRAGGSVSAAGDVDGDGYDDVLVGSSSNDEGASNVGAAYLVLGPIAGDLDLADADAKLLGESFDGRVHNVSGAGDVNGDGYDDIVVGVSNSGPTYYEPAGRAYLVHGPVAGTVPLEFADARLTATAWYDSPTRPAVGAGDVDGDGLDDLLVGSPDDDSGGFGAGAAFLMYGPVAGEVSLASADGEYIGEASFDGVGVSLDGAGDVDGDGLDDVLVGAYSNDAGGAAYVLYGPAAGSFDLADADAKLVGEVALDAAGRSVAGAGDVDGDGQDDVLVGADGESTGGEDAGAVYLVYGPVAGTLDLANADVKLTGEAEGDGAGFRVGGAGDVDGDGLDDVLVGAWFNAEGGTSAGATYLILGVGL